MGARGPPPRARLHLLELRGGVRAEHHGAGRRGGHGARGLARWQSAAPRATAGLASRAKESRGRAYRDDRTILSGMSWEPPSQGYRAVVARAALVAARPPNVADRKRAGPSGCRGGRHGPAA